MQTTVFRRLVASSLLLGSMASVGGCQLVADFDRSLIVEDAGAGDAGSVSDSGSAADAGSMEDMGSEEDMGSTADTGPADDIGSADDMGPPDASTADAG